MAFSQEIGVETEFAASNRSDQIDLESFCLATAASIDAKFGIAPEQVMEAVGGISNLYHHPAVERIIEGTIVPLRLGFVSSAVPFRMLASQVENCTGLTPLHVRTLLSALARQLRTEFEGREIQTTDRFLRFAPLGVIGVDPAGKLRFRLEIDTISNDVETHFDESLLLPRLENVGSDDLAYVLQVSTGRAADRAVERRISAEFSTLPGIQITQAYAEVVSRALMWLTDHGLRFTEYEGLLRFSARRDSLNRTASIYFSHSPCTIDTKLLERLDAILAHDEALYADYSQGRWFETTFRELSETVSLLRGVNSKLLLRPLLDGMLTVTFDVPAVPPRDGWWRDGTEHPTTGVRNKDRDLVPA